VLGGLLGERHDGRHFVGINEFTEVVSSKVSVKVVSSFIESLEQNHSGSALNTEFSSNCSIQNMMEWNSIEHSRERFESLEFFAIFVVAEENHNDLVV